ncbi:MAG: NAD(P)/FAD-dependent oxidoreductase [Bacteroidota bacterium]
MKANRFRNNIPEANKKILIVGAGVAGLYAGFTCKKENIDFQILEASDRVGGRLGKLEGFADFPLDLGAQWLHGKRNVLGRLVRSTDTIITKDRSDEFVWFKNQITKRLPKDIYKALKGNRRAPDISFLEYANRIGFGNEYRYIIEQIAGDRGADAMDLSIKWSAVEEEEWSSGNTDFKFEKTYFDLINDQITYDLSEKINLNTIVNSIDYSNDKVLITDKYKNIYEADKVLITVPISILQDGDITFNPPVPPSKIAAFHKIGIGPGMKVWMKFDEHFYHGSISGGSICASYSDEKEGKAGNDHVLMAFAMGHQARNLASLRSDKEITKALLLELDKMYDGKASESLIDSFVQDWSSEPFIRGAYSYSKLGIGGSRKIAAEPIASKIYFAGEAMNLNGHHQTVHGAAETGIDQINKIVESLK